MNIYEITFSDGAVTKTKAKADIWTGTPGVTSVVDLGAAPIPVVDEVPKLLSSTAFMDHCVAQFMSVNASTKNEAIARFQTVFEAARDSTDATYGELVRYAYARFQKADIVSKENVEELTAAFVAAGIMTSNERTAVLDNWPN